MLRIGMSSLVFGLLVYGTAAAQERSIADIQASVPTCTKPQAIPAGGKQSAEEAMIFVASGGAKRDLTPEEPVSGIKNCYEANGPTCTLTRYGFVSFGQKRAQRTVIDFNKFILEQTDIRRADKQNGDLPNVRFTLTGEAGAVVTQSLLGTSEQETSASLSVDVAPTQADAVVGALKHLYAEFCTGSKKKF